MPRLNNFTTACNDIWLKSWFVLEGIEVRKFDIVCASAESATDKRFLQSLKKNTSSSLVTCVVDESHTIELM